MRKVLVQDNIVATRPWKWIGNESLSCWDFDP